MALASLNYLKGAVFGFAAVSIWASWSVVTRLAVTTGLDASDIAALRFGVAGLLLPPVLLQRGLARTDLGGLDWLSSLPGQARPMNWWRRSGCALHPPTMAARSTRVACRCSLQ